VDTVDGGHDNLILLLF